MNHYFRKRTERLGGKSNSRSSQDQSGQKSTKRRKREDVPVVIQLINCLLVRADSDTLVKEHLWLQNGKIIDPQGRFWEANDNKSFAADVVIDCGGLIIAPGFIDIQINGAFGVDFSMLPNDIEEAGVLIDKVSLGLLSHGVTSYVPTIITSSPESYRTCIAALKTRMGPGSHETGAHILGIHLEGPFITNLGAHPPCLARPTTINHVKEVDDVYGDLSDVSIVTLAPETPGGLEQIEYLAGKDIKVSIGHTRATYDESLAAVEKGATLITHLFNAMSPFHHRDPGVIGLLGHVPATQRPFYSIITDGIHAHPTSAAIAYNSHPDGAVLVTDAMAAMGLPEGEYTLGTQQVVIKGFRATLRAKDAEVKESESKEVPEKSLNLAPESLEIKKQEQAKETLAGSVATMPFCLKNFEQFTLSGIANAAKAAALHPAQVLGSKIKQTKGDLSVGSDADLVIFTPEWDVKATIVLGHFVENFDSNLIKIHYNNKRGN